MMMAGIIMLLFTESARSQHVSTKLYTVNEGLPVSNIYFTYQDHFDYLWIGTFNGVSRFDGRDFVNYSLSDGLPSLSVDKIFEDDSYRLWVGTRGGMARLSGQKFITYPLSDSKHIKYTFDIIQTRKKEIWALTNEGVYQFNDSIWQKIDMLPGSTSPRQLIETDSGIYINYGKLIAFRNNEEKWRIVYEHPTDILYFNRMALYRGNIYVNTKQEIYHLQNDKLISIFQERSQNSHFAYFFDSHNRLWYNRLYYDKAIYVSEPGNYGELKALVPNSYGLVLTTIEDRFGNFWTATSSGLIRVSIAPFATQVKTVKHTSHFTNTIPTEDSSVLFVNNYSSLLGRYNRGSDSISISPLKEGLMDIIDCYDSDGNGKTWMITRSREFYTFQKGKLERSNISPTFATRELFTSMSFDKRSGRFFIGGDTSIYTLRNGEFKLFIPSNRKGKITGFINTLVTRDNKVLIYVHGEGIYLANEKDDIRLVFPIKNLNARFIKKNMIEDEEKNIWLAEETNVLLRLRFNDTGSLDIKDQFTKKDGLQDNTIYDLIADRENKIWIVTPSGIDIVQEAGSGKWNVFNYSKSIGLSVNTVYTELTKDQKGNIWLNDWTQTICFNADRIILKKPSSKIAIEKIQLNSRDVDWGTRGDSVQTYLMQPIDPKLSYKENSVSIYFNGISFSSNPHIEYSYQLVPVDSAWSNPSHNSTISFVQLRPGNYSFKVKARDQASEWSTPAIFNFTVLAPFWMTWWFISLSSIAVLAVIYTIYRYRLNQLKKLLFMRSRISRDLHDEVGSTLTSINILSRLSLYNLDSNKTRVHELLRKINEQSTSMQQSMSDIVWAVNPQNDSVSNLAARMREYLGHTVEPEGFEVEFLVGEHMLNDELSMNQRQHYFLVFKEAVNNAVKYSMGKKITVQLIRENHHITLAVQDDGKGFSRETVISSNGLKNMQARATELKGVLNITSGESGTTVELTCPAT
jgi:ligand-binding sensor domain-containing protein/two-component sensor histidine kinase